MQRETNNNSGHRVYKLTVKRAKITGIMCLALICVTLLFISPLFNIKTVFVKGNNYISSEAVLTAAAIKRGNNIFSLDTGNACREVKKLNRVSECNIERTLPGKVTINIKEETEVGYIKIKAGYAGIDENGRVLIVSKNNEMKCPLIVGLKIENPQKDDYIKSDDKKAKEKSDILFRILSELKNRGIVADIAEIDISDTGNINMTMVTKTIVNLGFDGQENEETIEYKIAFLDAILKKDYPKNGGIIELSDTDNVTIRVQ